MGRKDMPNEDIERVLREHFNAVASDLRAPGDPWDWLEGRLEPQPRPPLLQRLLGTRRGRFYPATKALAAAAASIVAVVAVVDSRVPQASRACQAYPATRASQAPQANRGHRSHLVCPDSSPQPY